MYVCLLPIASMWGLYEYYQTN